MKTPILFLLLVCLCCPCLRAQDISLYTQHNGRYDFVFVGNTMNTSENNLYILPCQTLTESSETLQLTPDDSIVAAYLYWAGSGPGDFEVELNSTPVSASRQFNYTHTLSGSLIYFSAFADVTQQLKATGNAVYTLSELDVNPYLTPTDYCNNATNFSGWSLVIIYENADLTLNQLNIYDGLQGVPMQIDITLDSLNVIDNVGAKIGFIAWEGDAGLSINETLRINGQILSNPPLNPANNAFNGTNSFTGATNLYNMDLDVYNIQNTISPGDSTAHIQLTSGQINANGQVQGDFVMVNVVVTKLNSQLPDATIVVDNVEKSCDRAVLVCQYTVFNTNSTDVLQENVPIAVYANGQLIANTQTTAPIPIGESLSGQITLTLPTGIPDVFQLVFSVDDLGNGMGIVTEISETNNEYTVEVALLLPPDFNPPAVVLTCNQGLGRGIFDFSAYYQSIKINPSDAVSFHLSQADAQLGINEISNVSAYEGFSGDVIHVRIQSDPCFAVTSFELRTRNCPPTVYNFVSVNNDGKNDNFYIDGLRDIFLNFKLYIYNRWGALLWEGNNQKANWEGVAEKGMIWDNTHVPDGTYYYVLELHDPDYPEPLTGFLYITR